MSRKTKQITREEFLKLKEKHAINCYQIEDVGTKYRLENDDILFDCFGDYYLLEKVKEGEN